MKMTPQDLGKHGEQRAAWHYQLRGFRVIERNARSYAGEVDLVLRRGNTVVIAEVKTRQTLIAGEGHQAVDRRKRERLIRLGDYYAARFPDAMLRYDIVSIFWTGSRFIVSHYEDAFRPVANAKCPWKWDAA